VRQGISRHEGQEDAVVARAAQHFLAQLVQQFGAPMHHPQVEEDTAQHQGLGLGGFGPASEVLDPAPQGLPPPVRAGHHLAGAVHVAAGIQPVIDKVSQRAKVCAVLCLVVVVGQDQAVVLVAPGRLLFARLGACSDPGIVHRRRAELGLSQRDQARRDGVGDGGDDVAVL
jgi:hypothetical protein